MTTFDRRTTALVLIDLQNGILGMPLAPRSGAEVLATATDLAARFRAAGWSDFAEGLVAPGDIVVTKRQWGAFYGTDLDLQLRRRGVTTIVPGGIATNFGVESTARSAWEHGYAVVVAEDATTSLTAEMHGFSVEHILPRIGIVSRAADIRLEQA